MARKKPPKMARKKLAKGWTEGTVAEFLGLSEAEAAEVERRVQRSTSRKRSSKKRSKKLAKTVDEAHRRYGKVFKRLAE